jgi:exopolysaccharide/PEP-CTERM locus tyrosine autokinase
MTDQTPIPVPGKRSLFERAEDVLGDGQFQPAPVPQELAAASRRRVTRPVKVEPAVIDDQLPPSRLREGTGVGPSAGDSPTPNPSREREGDDVAPAAAPRIQFTGPRVAIDRARLRTQGLIQPEGAVTTLLEEFRLVKRQLLLAAREGRSREAAQRVLVCSPLPAEGKTFCAINLALAIAAEKDSEVVLVDADFAKPSIPAQLGFSAGAGLMDALADPKVRVEECVLSTDVAGLYVLPAGNPTAHDSEYLASGRTPEVLARLTQRAPNRMVIFDSPPALAASPASELAGHVGQALVICRADRTGMSALEDALSLLSACPDIKLLLNAANFSPSGRRFGTYYGHEG